MTVGKGQARNLSADFKLPVRYTCQMHFHTRTTCKVKTKRLFHITYHILCINWLTCWSPVGTLSRPEEDGFPP
uniref:Uncharacterized protein n=1 Tax=Anguilla anguilla TaxID=7936 RepID=A0A0E9WG06_ANGAN